MNIVGPITYNSEELAFADKIMKENEARKWSHKTTGSKREDPSGGSTDVGDVSYIPEITLMATTALMSWHSWVVVASGGMSIDTKACYLLLNH
jgi:hypothetical protein